MSNTPHIKFEHSPADSLADSFVSTPGTIYPPLFNDTMNPAEAMTPQSHYDEDSMFGDSMNGGSMAGTPAPEKKPVKKRKSWGQQLPEPKTNLPPRKRAKTEDEKEQRRVERVLRNRRAAQSSRERKRQEVEALENEKRKIEAVNDDLQRRLNEMEARNLELMQELAQFTGGMTVFRASIDAATPAQADIRSTQTPVTFSQELFGSRDAPELPISTQSIVKSEPTRTLNPASLSPEIRPVDESANASSSDMTQHPAAMLCDLQCQSEEQRPWMSSPATQTWAVTLLMITSVTSSILSPLNQIVNTLKTQSYLSPTHSILTLIIWMVTTAAPLTTSTSTTSYTNMKTSQRPRFSLWIRMLRRLLASNPHLARPLMDATMSGMRLASEQQLSHACLSGVDASPRHGEQKSPSVETLMTLLWAIHVISKENSQSETPKLDAATEIRQTCDELFRLGEMRRGRGNSIVEEMGTPKKSLDGWRPARP